MALDGNSVPHDKYDFLLVTIRDMQEFDVMINNKVDEMERMYGVIEGFIDDFNSQIYAVEDRLEKVEKLLVIVEKRVILYTGRVDREVDGLDTEIEALHKQALNITH